MHCLHHILHSIALQMQAHFCSLGFFSFDHCRHFTLILLQDWILFHCCWFFGSFFFYPIDIVRATLLCKYLYVIVYQSYHLVSALNVRFTDVCSLLLASSLVRPFVGWFSEHDESIQRSAFCKCDPICTIYAMASQSCLRPMQISAQPAPKQIKCACLFHLSECNLSPGKHWYDFQCILYDHLKTENVHNISIIFHWRTLKTF